MPVQRALKAVETATDGNDPADCIAEQQTPFGYWWRYSPSSPDEPDTTLVAAIRVAATVAEHEARKSGKTFVAITVFARRGKRGARRSAFRRAGPQWRRGVAPVIDAVSQLANTTPPLKGQGRGGASCRMSRNSASIECPSRAARMRRRSFRGASTLRIVRVAFEIPALLTRPCRPPSFWAVSTARAQSASEVTSCRTKDAAGPSSAASVWPRRFGPHRRCHFENYLA
jgi:hypothetical protein